MKVCSIDGCDKPVHAHSVCGPHYQRWRRRQDDAPACSIEGCEDRVAGRGWCNKHWKRWKRTGDPQHVCDLRGARNPCWRGDAITYMGMHDRVRALRGKASDCICRCGAPATDWAYTHDCPNEKTGRAGRIVAPYSTDPNRYVPMCKSCHTALDREHANERKSA